jgi:hypothetical protein
MFLVDILNLHGDQSIMQAEEFHLITSTYHLNRNTCEV